MSNDESVFLVLLFLAFVFTAGEPDLWDRLMTILDIYIEKNLEYAPEKD